MSSSEELASVIRQAVQARAAEIVMEHDDVEQAWVRFQQERFARRRTTRRRVIIATVAAAAVAAAVVIATNLQLDSDKPEPVITPTVTQTEEPAAEPTILVEPQAPDNKAFLGTTYLVRQGKLSFSYKVPPELSPGITSFGMDNNDEYTLVYAAYAEGVGWPQIAVLAPDDVFDPTQPVHVNDDADVPAPATLDAWVQWFQDHPYLDTSQVQPAELSGARGVTFDVLDVEQPPGRGCCTLTGSPTNIGVGIDAGSKAQVWVLDVDGVPVVVFYSSQAAKYDENRPMFDLMLDSIIWNPSAP